MRETGVRWSPRRLYRVVGRDLWSVNAEVPLAEQRYELVAAGVVDAETPAPAWRVRVVDDRIWLEKEEPPG